MSKIKKYIDVILPLPVKGTFTYFTYESNLLIGQRVVVQFGIRKLYSAVVKSIHNNVMKYIASEYTKCSINDGDTIMKKGGTGGLDCKTGTQYLAASDITAHLESTSTSPIEDKNPYDTDSLAVDEGTGDAYSAGTVTISPTSDSLITITTCFGNGKSDEPCAADNDFVLKNTVTVE